MLRRCSLQESTGFGIREAGQLGQVGSAGGDIGEIKFKRGSGYRIYFMRVGSKVILLLGGGTKKTQPKDIRKVHLIGAALEK